MPYPSEGGGSAGGGDTPLPPTAIPDLYNPIKTIRSFFDCNAAYSGGASDGISSSPQGSGTVTTIAADATGHLCIWEVFSSATAGSGLRVAATMQGTLHATKPTLTVYFKTPVAINSNTTIQVGSIIQASADRCGIEIIGSTLQAKVIVAGVTTQSGGTYTVAANTWYIARVTYTGDSGAVCKLFSETGVELYSFTITVALLAAGFIGFAALNSGTTAGVSLAKLDIIEVVVNAPDRFYLPV
jgi:hypothetical protein